MSAALEVGKVYTVAHSRKGAFTMRLTDVDDTWATGIVTNGKAGAMLAYNEREEGEEITVRRSLCQFSPIAGAA